MIILRVEIDIYIYTHTPLSNGIKDKKFKIFL